MKSLRGDKVSPLETKLVGSGIGRTKMAADFGETLDLLEKRVTALERRLLTNNDDLKKFEQSSVRLIASF